MLSVPPETTEKSVSELCEWNPVSSTWILLLTNKLGERPNWNASIKVTSLPLLPGRSLGITIPLFTHQGINIVVPFEFPSL